MRVNDLDPARAALVVLGVTIVAVVWSLGGVGGGALLGFDAYPLIAASRVDSLGSFFGTFGEELMDGRYPDGHFYRPLVHLSFAFDHAIGGLDAGRYMATDLTILVLASWMIGLVAARFVGTSDRARMAAGIAAALLFALHRAQLDIVPYAPRRADGLCVLFIAATAYASARGTRTWIVGVLALCAFLSKESGVIALPIAFAASFARDQTTVKSAARALIAPLAAVTVGVVVRTVVLGGLGGHAESGTATFGDAWAVVNALLRALTTDTPGGRGAVLWLLLGLAIPLWRTRSTRAALGLAALWSTSALAITLVSGRYHDWYLLALLPGAALAVGVAVGRAVEEPRVVTVLAGCAALTLTVLFAVASLGAAQREALQVAQRIAADQVERFQSLVEPLGPRDEATFTPWVSRVAAAPGAPPIFVHAPYSLSALGDLTLAGTPVVAVAPGRLIGPRPASVLVRLVPGPPPSEVR